MAGLVTQLEIAPRRRIAVDVDELDAGIAVQPGSRTRPSAAERVAARHSSGRSGVGEVLVVTRSRADCTFILAAAMSRRWSGPCLFPPVVLHAPSSSLRCADGGAQQGDVAAVRVVSCGPARWKPSSCMLGQDDRVTRGGGLVRIDLPGAELRRSGAGVRHVPQRGAARSSPPSLAAAARSWQVRGRAGGSPASALATFWPSTACRCASQPARAEIRSNSTARSRILEPHSCRTRLGPGTDCMGRVRLTEA